MKIYQVVDKIDGAVESWWLTREDAEEQRASILRLTRRTPDGRREQAIDPDDIVIVERDKEPTERSGWQRVDGPGGCPIWIRTKARTTRDQ